MVYLLCNHLNNFPMDLNKLLHEVIEVYPVSNFFILQFVCFFV